MSNPVLSLYPAKRQVIKLKEQIAVWQDAASAPDWIKSWSQIYSDPQIEGSAPHSEETTLLFSHTGGTHYAQGSMRAGSNFEFDATNLGKDSFLKMFSQQREVVSNFELDDGSPLMRKRRESWIFMR